MMLSEGIGRLQSIRRHPKGFLDSGAMRLPHSVPSLLIPLRFVELYTRYTKI